MAAATWAVYGTSDRVSEDIRTTPLGWVGSKAGARGDVIVIASGYIDQAHAAGGAVSTSARLGILCTDMASTDAAASANALACQYRVPGDQTEMEFALVNNSDTLITPANTDIDTIIGLYRRSTGEYVADRNGSTTFHVTRINLARGTVFGTIVATLRLK